MQYSVMESVKFFSGWDALYTCPIMGCISLLDIDLVVKVNLLMPDYSD